MNFFHKSKSRRKMYALVLACLVGYCRGFTGFVLENNMTSEIKHVKNTQLVFAFIIHHHGDQTPVSQSKTAFSSDPEALHRATIPFGYNELTNAGKQRAFRLGRFIRRRYGELLSPKYKHSDIYIRTTDDTTSKMTVLVAMAAVYPPVAPHWTAYINWDPVPYTVVPAEYDFLRPTANCPNFKKMMHAAFLSKPKSLIRYHGTLANISYLLGFAEPILQTFPVLSYSVNQVFTSQVSLGIRLPPKLAALWPKLNEAAGLGLQTLFGSEKSMPLHSGPLLQDFLDHSAQIMAGKQIQKVRIYSARDTNVYALRATLQQKANYVAPKYGALLSLELRRFSNTGKYFVVAAYLSSPEKRLGFFRIKGCSNNLLCSYTKFQKSMSRYALNIHEWRKQCGMVDDSKEEKIFDRYQDTN